MKKPITYIAEFEELVLLAILKLGEEAYGAAIHEVLEDVGRRVSIGALYTTLSRIEGKGLVSSWIGEPTSERGGRAKKYFKVRSSGERALREAHAARAKLSLELGFTLGGASA
jgi:DNA-binding PadR family transcriptional regulator